MENLSDYLVCVSAGRLGLLDYDEVELSNLHRQVLHGEENQGQAKALSAANALKRYSIIFILFSACAQYSAVYRGQKLLNTSIIS